jgi:predicted nucleic acid-binding Zn finger protein
MSDVLVVHGRGMPFILRMIYSSVCLFIFSLFNRSSKPCVPFLTVRLLIEVSCNMLDVSVSVK